MTTICLTMVCAQGLHATKNVCTNVTTVDKNHILSFPQPPLFFVLPLSDGVGRTGTFICLHSQLERLKTEGVVDFLQAVKASRIQRTGLVPDAVCLLSLHSLLTGHHTVSLILAFSLVLNILEYTQVVGHKS